jgi:hypothetical protein
MKIKSITLGYWYPRTTLHLAEVVDFVRTGHSPVALDKRKLLELHKALDITESNLIVDTLEHLSVSTRQEITIKFYEDGLVTLSKNIDSLKQDRDKLQAYFEDRFSPAISYLFSLGAPVPKELANIHTVYPFFIVTEGATREDADEILKELGRPEEDYQLTGKGVEIYRGKEFFLLNGHKNFKHIDQLIETLIFFKEFKSQLHHYLNLHRSIWEKIAHVRERKVIHGREVRELRNELESYRKTIELIDGRIAQMPLYMEAREQLITELGWESVLTNILNFKYGNLNNSLKYIQVQWSMTKKYVDAAIEVFNEINAQSTKNSVGALTVITSIGVVNTLIAFLGTKQYPSVTMTGVFYLIVLISLTWALNQFVSFVFQMLQYKINDIKIAKNLNK